MIYLVCQDWSNTSNNHAGMKYLCCQLEQRYPSEYKCLIVPDFYVIIKKNLIARKIQHLHVQLKYRRILRQFSDYIKVHYTDGDKIFLMEYLELLYPQILLSKMLKHYNLDIQIYAMVHLVPSRINRNFSEKRLKKWSSYINKYVTLGTSLTNFLKTKGMDNVCTTFHYVDTEYYRPTENHYNHAKLTVIAMGNQMRNKELLIDIVRNNDDVHFVICQGVGDMKQDFKSFENVKLIPFVSEQELKGYMNMADISLNVMIDTIGSNVIVTSMAMGLAMVCSNVGSIRNYCDETNAIFCDNNNPSSFTRAIKGLASDKVLLDKMKMNSYKKAQELSIEKFHNNFQML